MEMNKVVVGGVLVVLLIIGGIFLLSRGGDQAEIALDANGNPIEGVDGVNGTSGSNNSSGAGSNNGSVNTNASGRLVFMVTDAAAKMTDVSEITLKISKVEVHSTASGWVTASSTARSFNLLDLKAKNQSKLLADVNIKHGIYDQVRLTLDSVSVKLKTGVTKVAALPGKTFTIGTNLVVTSTPSMARFDFIADESLHLTTTNDYVFAPVVITESQSGVELTIDGAGIVQLKSGEQRDIGTEGMDADGTVKADFKLSPKNRLVIGADGKVKIEFEDKPKGVILNP